MKTEWYWSRTAMVSPLILIIALILLNAFFQSTFLQCKHPWLIECEAFKIENVFIADATNLKEELAKGDSITKGPHRHSTVARHSGRMIWTFFSALNMLLCCLIIYLSSMLIKNSPNVPKFYKWGGLWPVLTVVVIIGCLLLSSPQAHMYYVKDLLTDIVGSESTGSLGVVGIFEAMNFLNVLTFVTGLLLAYTSCVILYVKKNSFDQFLKLEAIDITKKGGALHQVVESVSLLRLVLYLGAALLIVGVFRMMSLLDWSTSFLIEDSIAHAKSFNVALISITGGFFTAMLAVIYFPSMLILKRRGLEMIDLLDLSTEDREKKVAQSALSFSFKDTVPRMIAILGPLIAGPVGDFLIKLVA